MIESGTDTILRRPLSIHSSTKDSGQLKLLYAIKGRGTTYLSSLKSGDRVGITGPLGNGYEIYPDTRKLLLLAGGLGVAPILFLSQSAIAKGISVTLLHGTKSETDIYPEHLLPDGIKAIFATEDGSFGRQGLVTDSITEMIQEADQICACGPLAMYYSLKEMTPKYPDISVQVSLELRLGCGIGACYGCSIPTRHGVRQVCRDGPVFNLDDLELAEIRL